MKLQSAQCVSSKSEIFYAVYPCNNKHDRVHALLCPEFYAYRKFETYKSWQKDINRLKGRHEVSSLWVSVIKFIWLKTEGAETLYNT